jgi:DNA-binding transcriptional LysR family regulator
MEKAVDLATLAIFRTVARELSITRAAQQLGRVPSNVTTRIQQLEEELGVVLFERDRKRFSLTAQGELFLDYADRILNLSEEAQQVLKPRAPTGVLRIGSMECTVASRLPLPLARFHQRWPDVRLEVSTAPSRQLIDAVRKRRLDCALVALPPGDSEPDPDEIETGRCSGRSWSCCCRPAMSRSMAQPISRPARSPRSRPAAPTGAWPRIGFRRMAACRSASGSRTSVPTTRCLPA